MYRKNKFRNKFKKFRQKAKDFPVSSVYIYMKGHLPEKRGKLALHTL